MAKPGQSGLLDMYCASIYSGSNGLTSLLKGVGTGLALTVTALALGACQSLPESGPPARAVAEGAKAPAGMNYYLVTVSPQVMQIINARREKDLDHKFADGKAAPMQPVGIGDTVSVTIWESSGLFAAGRAGVGSAKTDFGAVAQTANQNVAYTLPNQAVSQTGDINVPFAGRIPAAGLLPSQVEKEILAAIKDKTIAPQVLVTVTDNASAFVTVAGDVAHPGRIPLSTNGTRLLDAVALAGGATALTSDIAVQLTRDGVTQRVRLDALVREPAENVFLRPRDLVYLVKEPQTAVILGATPKNSQVSFIKASMSLAEVIGNGGGLSDTLADPHGVFVFRYEPASVVQSLGPQTVEPDASDQVPVVYQINLKEPQGYFVAQAFPIRDRDLIYVANTDTVQLAKLANLVHTFTSLFSTTSYTLPVQ